MRFRPYLPPNVNAVELGLPIVERRFRNHVFARRVRPASAEAFLRLIYQRYKYNGHEIRLQISEIIADIHSAVGEAGSRLDQRHYNVPFTSCRIDRGFLTA